MAGLIQKLGAEKVKHHLEVEIHYIRLKLAASCQLSVEVQRGKKMHKETQAMMYSPESAFVQFDYPIGFDITMHKKGSKYVKKNFVIKLHQIDGKNKVNNGRVKIDFSQIPVLNKPIVRREVPLQHCTDPSAVVSISVRLEKLEKSKNSFSNNLSPNSSVLSPSSSVLAAEAKKPPEKSQEKKLPTDPLSLEVEGPKRKEPVHVMPVEIIETSEEPYKVEDPGESFDSRMSFSDFIVNPKESEVSSEDSSEEEEVKEVPKERLVAHAIPKTTRDQVTPNEGSKAEQITRIEEKGGISAKRQGNCLNSCGIF